MQIVNEGLKSGDLEGVISDSFSIDQYKSKMGNDANIIVLAFTVEGQQPAKDLERFAETGYKSVLDADATPGTLEDGKHKVFIEFARTPNVLKEIMLFLDDLKKLTNIESFNYTYRKNTNPTMVSLESLATVPTTPEAYETNAKESKTNEAKKFFDQYNTSLVSAIMISDLSNDNVSKISASYDKTGNDSDTSSIVIFSLLLQDETIREIKKIK